MQCITPSFPSNSFGCQDRRQTTDDRRTHGQIDAAIDGRALARLATVVREIVDDHAEASNIDAPIESGGDFFHEPFLV
jgi:hypothetical protein